MATASRDALVSAVKSYDTPELVAEMGPSEKASIDAKIDALAVGLPDNIPLNQFPSLLKTLTGIGQPKRDTAQMNIVDKRLNTAHTTFSPVGGGVGSDLATAEAGLASQAEKATFREQVVSRQVGSFIGGTSDLSTLRTSLLGDVATGRMTPEMVDKVIEQAQKKLDEQVSLLEGKTPSEIESIYNATSNPDLKTRIESKYGGVVSQSKRTSLISNFLGTNGNFSTFDASLNAAVNAGNLTQEEAMKARQELFQSMNERARNIADQVRDGSMSITDASNISNATNNPELQAAIDRQLEALDTVNMEPGGTDAATAVDDLITNSPDFNTLGSGLQAVLQNQATTELAGATELRRIGTENQHLANFARSIEGNAENLGRRINIEFFVRRFGPVVLATILAGAGILLIPGAAALTTVWALLGSGATLAGIHAFLRDGGRRAFQSQSLKTATENYDIASKAGKSAIEANAAAATNETQLVQRVMKANSKFRAERYSADPKQQASIAQFINNQLGANISF